MLNLSTANGWLSGLLLLLVALVWMDVPVGGFLASSSRPPFFHHHHCPTAATRRTLTRTTIHETEDNDQVVLQLERKVSTLTSQLKREERRATESRNEWMLERTQLAHKISVMTTLLQQRETNPPPSPSQPDHTQHQQALELQLAMSREHEEDLLQEQDRLVREVTILQNEIVNVRNLHKTEQYVSQDLHYQLDTLTQERDAERMEWQRMVEAQKRHIESLQLQVESMAYAQTVPQAQKTVPATKTTKRKKTTKTKRRARNETMAVVAT
ncbi:expressed unknown protein [Seminavis robusta]|uniref:Uncharacterized protein n=1 Tax=Seminavis robusta TaxID=568900 RepID=A0A9N8DFR2_9STRA|nr:expressed unknown protein [Seminavis robusta]|eukprot:Sro136_g063930.1 n/a (269) ;mRNA; r:5914-6720